MICFGKKKTMPAVTAAAVPRKISPVFSWWILSEPSWMKHIFRQSDNYFWLTRHATHKNFQYLLGPVILESPEATAHTTLSCTSWSPSNHKKHQLLFASTLCSFLIISNLLWFRAFPENLSRSVPRGTRPSVKTDHENSSFWFPESDSWYLMGTHCLRLRIWGLGIWSAPAPTWYDMKLEA